MSQEPRSIEIKTDDVAVFGVLSVPENPKALVILVPGNGGSRSSPRSQFLARALNRAGLACLPVDLLTAEEDQTGSESVRCDIPMLARRLTSVTDWVVNTPETRGLRVGYFGTEGGAAAALAAAARRPAIVDAVVARTGRLDLVMEVLELVVAPTRLIVGSGDPVALELNELARARLSYVDLVVVPGAANPSEDRGALPRVAALAVEWFSRYLAPPNVRVASRPSVKAPSQSHAQP